MVRIQSTPLLEEKSDTLATGPISPSALSATILSASAPDTQRDTLKHTDRVGFFDDCGIVLSYVRAADIFRFKSTHKVFRLMFSEATAADCTVITVAHSDYAVAEFIRDAGLLVESAIGILTKTPEAGFCGDWDQKFQPLLGPVCPPQDCYSSPSTSALR